MSIIHSEADAIEEVRAVTGALAKAWHRWDADAFADLYTADAVVALPGTVLRSRDDIRAYMASAFAGPLARTRLDTSDLRIHALTDDVAIATNVTGTLMPGMESVTQDQYRRAVWTLVRDGDRWRIAAYANTPVTRG